MRWREREGGWSTYHTAGFVRGKGTVTFMCFLLDSSYRSMKALWGGGGVLTGKLYFFRVFFSLHNGVIDNYLVWGI